MRKSLPDGEHRPVPELITALAERVVDGRIRLPRFQREWAWSRQQVLDLMDSIARNYPIGSLVLWRSSASLASATDITGLRIEARDDEETTYLLDGYQRLSAICGALYWEGGNPKSDWNIVYDLAEQTFRHRTDLGEPPAHQVPLRLIREEPDFFERIIGLDEVLRRRAATLFRRFTRYEVAVVTLHGTSLSEIGRIFERLNTRGTPLTTVELVRAATWTHEFDLFAEIDGVRRVLARKHYGAIDRKLMLRAIAAAAGFGFTATDIEHLPGLAPGDLGRAIAHVARAAPNAVDFLCQQIGTPSADELPCPSQLIVVMEIFRQVPRPDARQLAEIRRWFWRTALTGYYEGWSAQKMTADRAAVTAFGAGAPVIDVDVPPLTTRFWRTGQYRRDSPRTKAFALMLAAAEPRDLRTGARIATGKALSLHNDTQYHHFFPKSWLLARRIPLEEANVLANVVMLTAASNQAIGDRPPSAYLEDVIRSSGESQVIARLRTSLVSPEAFEAALRDDYEAFIRIRADTLVDWAGDLTRGEDAVSRGDDP